MTTEINVGWASFTRWTYSLAESNTQRRSFLLRAENINDKRYFVAHPPTGTGSLFNTGPPSLFRMGLRLNFPAERK